ncbi:MAG: hypothetical protein II916_11225 [Oscillospiraceae bacterium]|nr:hypothetical protein [Oscillospiraceae bacterium]
MSAYNDMMLLPRFEPRNHRRMGISARAAQFAPFAALTGFDEQIGETARQTDAQHILTEDEMAALNQALVWLLEHESEKPLVTVVYFQPDAFKQGGAYLTYCGHLRFFDEAEGLLKFTDGTVIAVRAIQHLYLRKESHEII